jgi:hypothetical protein
MKTLRFLIRIVGLGLFVTGLFYFLDAINSITNTTNVFAIVLRLVNGSVWFIAGYGLLRLQKWSLYVVGGMVMLFIGTLLFNWYASGIAPSDVSRLGLRPLGFIIVLFFLLLSKQDEFF